MAEVHPLVQSFIKGQQASIVTIGPSHSGKTYSMYGGQSAQSRGFLFRAVERCLQVTTPFIGGGMEIRSLDKKPSAAIMQNDLDFKEGTS